MKTKLTLQEKLRDLRDEQGLTLSMLAGKTGIPLSTLQRMEGSENIRVGYQDVMAIAKFYDVSTDYLFGLTDNHQFRHIEIDALRLSDEAVRALRDEKLNGRLVSEVLAHPDFAGLMQAVEIYIDRKLAPQIKQVNDIFSLAEKTLKENVQIEDGDDIIAQLQGAVVNEDGYLRFRISERFNDMLKGLFDAHKRDDVTDEQAPIIKSMTELLAVYMQEPDKELGKVMMLAKQIGRDYSELDEDEIAALKRVVKIAQSRKGQPGKRRQK